MRVSDTNATLRVRVSRETYRRAGFVFGSRYVEVRLADFDDEEDDRLRIDRIMRDPALHIDIWEAGKKLPKAEVAKIRQQFADNPLIMAPPPEPEPTPEPPQEPEPEPEPTLAPEPAPQEKQPAPKPSDKPVKPAKTPVKSPPRKPSAKAD